MAKEIKKSLKISIENITSELIDNCSLQRFHAKWAETGIRYMTLKQEMESSPHGNLCAALCTATKTTTNITKTTDDDQGGKGNKEISKEKNLFLHGVIFVSGLACLAGASVEQQHLFPSYLHYSCSLSHIFLPEAVDLGS